MSDRHCTLISLDRDGPDLDWPQENFFDDRH